MIKISFQQNIFTFNILIQTQNWNISQVQKPSSSQKKRQINLHQYLNCFLGLIKSISNSLQSLKVKNMISTTKQNKIVIGHATFNSQFTNLLRNQLIKRDQERWLNTLELRLKLCSSNYQKRKKIVSYIKQSDATALINLFYMLDTEFLFNICSIDFQNLKIINFLASQIQSIESFQFLKAPKLQQVSLTINRITKLNSWFQKIKYIQLKYLHLSSNLMKQINLGRLFSHKNIELEIFDSWTKSSVQNLNFFAKINSSAQIKPNSLKNYKSIETDEQRNTMKGIPQSKCVDALTRKRIYNYS